MTATPPAGMLKEEGTIHFKGLFDLSEIAQPAKSILLGLGLNNSIQSSYSP